MIDSEVGYGWRISGTLLDDLIEILSTDLPYSTMRASGCTYAARTTRWMCVLRLLLLRNRQELLQGGDFLSRQPSSKMIMLKPDGQGPVMDGKSEGIDRT
jgi:hypothetical protein